MSGSSDQPETRPHLAPPGGEDRNLCGTDRQGGRFVSPDTTTLVYRRAFYVDTQQDTMQSPQVAAPVGSGGHEPNLWSPSLSRALRERYGGTHKRTPRTLTRLMQQHRENERHRHNGLNASIREISRRIPGYDESQRETKIVKLQHIISYVCHLEGRIKGLADGLGFSLDYRSLFLSPHIAKTADSWKTTANRLHARTALFDQCVPHKRSVNLLKRRRPLSSPTIDSTSDHIVPQAPISLPQSQQMAAVAALPQVKRRRTVLVGTSGSSGLPHTGAPAWRSQGQDEGRESAETSLERGSDISWLEELLTSPATTMTDICQVFDVPDVSDLPVPQVTEQENVVGMHGDVTTDFTDVTRFQSCAHGEENVRQSHSVTTAPQQPITAPPGGSDGDGGPRSNQTPGCHSADLKWSVVASPAAAYPPPCTTALPRTAVRSTSLHQGEAPVPTGGSTCSCSSAQVVPSDSVSRRQRQVVRRYDNCRVDHRKTSWMNGFMMYSRLHRRQYIGDNPGVHTSHISKMMGQDWRSLTAEQQQPYRVKAKHYIQCHILPRLPHSFRNKTNSALTCTARCNKTK